MRSYFYQRLKLNIVPNGIGKKTNIRRMWRVGLMPKALYPSEKMKGGKMIQAQFDKKYIAMLLLEAICIDNNFPDNVQKNVLIMKEKYCKGDYNG